VLVLAEGLADRWLLGPSLKRQQWFRQLLSRFSVAKHLFGGAYSPVYEDHIALGIILIVNTSGSKVDAVLPSARETGLWCVPDVARQSPKRGIICAYIRVSDLG